MARMRLASRRLVRPCRGAGVAESCGKSPTVPPWQGPSGSDGESAVSRYFRYKSSQSLLDDARRMGLAIELDEDLSPLRSSIQVASRRVGNRLTIQPME